MPNVYYCVTEQHDLRLVGLAVVLCVLAAGSGLSLLQRAAALDGRARLVWLALAATVAGIGVWSTHFVAMLAYDAGVPVGYDLPLTILSVAIAIATIAGGWALAIYRPRLAAVGGGIAAAGIAIMHFTGMAAVNLPGRLEFDPLGVTEALAVSIALGALSLYLGSRVRGFWAPIAAAGPFVLSVASVHFVAMAAVTIVPDPTRAAGTLGGIPPSMLAVVVAMAAIIVIMLSLAGAAVDRRLAARSELEAERLRAHVHALEATQATLEATREKLEGALRDAIAADVAKSQFLAAMSHELRTPLNAVIGFSDLMRGEMLGPLGTAEYKEFSETIYTSGTSLLGLIERVLDLTQIDAGKLKLTEEPIDLAALISGCAALSKEEMAQKQLELTIDLPDTLPRIRGDAPRLRQSLLNLLSNAAKFNREGGKVSLAVTRRDGDIVIAVSDTGIGIATDDIPKALARFGQVDNRLNRSYDGPGLGLTLAKEMIEQHGGTIEVESEPGVGTTVRLVIPAARVIAPPKAVPAAAAE